MNILGGKKRSARVGKTRALQGGNIKAFQEFWGGRSHGGIYDFLHRS